MKVADFGRFDAPLVLFGGIYSNLQAFFALTEAAGAREMICTGDVVAYCGDPVDTTAAYVLEDMHGIAGNCERQLEVRADDCGCGFGSGTTCDLLSRGWYAHLKAEMRASEIEALAALPDIATFQQGARRYGVIHGGVHQSNRFLWPSSPPDDFLHEISNLEAIVGKVDGVIAGHSGIAFQRRIGDHHWINAGAIGLPPHDGRAETRYAVLDNGEAVIHRLSYDHVAARRRMEEVGLVQGYHDTLSTGIWPSEDVLPDELKR